MDTGNILNSLFALIFVLCLIGLISLIIRKYGNGVQINSKANRRLKIKEVLNIDSRKKIVLLEKDDKEYLVAFNDSAIEVIDE